MAECKFAAIWSRKADDVVIVSPKLKCNSHLEPAPSKTLCVSHFFYVFFFYFRKRALVFEGFGFPR